MCECRVSMDIRERCDYKLNAKTFKNCLARCDTSLFHLANDYETYKLLEKAKSKKQKEAVIKRFIDKTMKIRSLEDKAIIIKLYWEQEMDEEELKEREEREIL